MRYAIWHTPRSGSNLLCNLLHLTGVAGIADYENCGFCVGFGEELKNKNLVALADEYFDKQRTLNGVAGTKLSMEYIRDILPYVGRRDVYKVLRRFDRHIFLTRRDKVAQAVSFIFAQDQNYFSTRSSPTGELSQYSDERITMTMGYLKALEEDNQTWLARYTPYTPTVTYDDIASYTSRFLPMKNIFIHLGITWDKKYADLEPQIDKQVDNRKLDWVKKYKWGV